MKIRTPRLAIPLLLLVAGAVSPTQAISQSVLDLSDDFDAYVESTMSHWGAPGVVVIVAKPGSEPLIRTYGSRLLGRDAPITDQTLFPIASNTKSITGIAAGLLAREGELSWDEPVRVVIPEFALADESMAAAITLRDLMSHQAGLPPQIGRFFSPDRTAEDLLAVLAMRTPSLGLRESFEYSNVGVAVAGEAVARSSGLTYEEFIRRRLFESLGMTSTYTSGTDFLARTGNPSSDRDMFMPAVRQDGQIVPGDWEATVVDQVYAPAGGVISTAADISRWMEMLAGRGRYRGQTIVPSDVLDEVWSPQVEVGPESGLFDHPEAPVSYGLGWAIYDHNGYKIVEHGGGFMSSVIAVAPELEVSVGVFTNAYFSERHAFESIFMASALKLRAFDELMDRVPRDWSPIFEEALGR